MTSRALRPHWPVFLLALSLLLSASASATSNFELRPGVVVDAESGTVFTMSPEGGLDAWELTSGNLRWHNGETDKPLAVVEGRVLTQTAEQVAGQLQLAVVDAATGRLEETSALELPEHVIAGVADALEHRFRTWTTSDANGVALGWEHTARIASAIPLTNISLGGGEAKVKTSSTTSGGLHLALDAGGLIPLAVKSVPRRGSRQVLTRGMGLANVSGRQFLSLDGRHILVSEHVDKAAWRGHRWNVYTRDGAWIGEAESFVAFAPFVVVDSQLLYTTPPYARRDGRAIDEASVALRAIDLRSGSEAWSQEVLDTEYRGPFPP